jgi:cyclic beta-1,2-glucan synthetase
MPHPAHSDRRPAFAATAVLESSVPSSLESPIASTPMTLTNGLGGFSDEGRTYTIIMDGDQETPLPWVNVIANASFGTVVTAAGSAHTWSENSRENRLTSFANDPVVDPTAEALFIRDDDSGDAWSPTPGPMARHATSGQFVVHHSAGVTRFARTTRGIRHELAVFVDADDPVKFSLLTLTGDGEATRTRPVCL